MAARQSAADGYTLVVVTSSTHGSTPALRRTLPYDPIKDFALIALMGEATLVLLVREDLPVHSVADLVKMLREKPGQLNYSTGGYGSQHHLATVTLFQRAGLPQNAAVHVPFAGLAPALMSLIGGSVQFMTSRPAPPPSTSPAASCARSRPPACNDRPDFPMSRPWRSSASRASRSRPGAAWRRRPARLTRS